MPQGSVIATIVCSVMLQDNGKIVQLNGLDVHLSLYADDLAIWAYYHSHKVGLLPGWLKRYQEQICSAYMAENGFQFSAEKTALMVFSSSVQIRSPVSIKPSTQAKFIGVVLSQDLQWTHHIRHLSTKAFRGLALIKLLSGQN